MAAEKAWLKAFTSGSQALQRRLREVHANNPEFQSFLGKHGFEGGSSVKQASKAQTVSKEVAAKRTELSNKAYGATTGAKVGGEHGSSDEYKDTTVPLTKDQHSKVQAAKKAALTKDERFAAIARATRKARDKYDLPTIEDPDNAGYDDMMDLHHSLHIGHGSSLDEEAQKHRINVTMTNPNHISVIKRDEKIQKILRVPAENPEEAVHKAWDYYKKQGYKVHEAEHIGMVSEASMKGMPFTDAEKARLAKYDQADKQKINKRVTTRKYEGDDAYSHAVFVDGKPVITGLHKSQVKHYMKQASDKLNEEVGLDEAAKYGRVWVHATNGYGRHAVYAETHDGEVKRLHGGLGHLAARRKAGEVAEKHGLSDTSSEGSGGGWHFGPSSLHKEEVELDEATKAYKDPITGQVTQIPAHKAPTYGFNKFGQFASLDRVPKPRKKLHNTAHHLMRTVDEFEEGSPERQAVTDALKKVVGAIKEAKDLSKDLTKRVELVTGGEKTLVRNKSGVLVARKVKKNVQEAHIDPNFVATFGVAAAAYDHVLNPLLKKAKQKIADKMAEKLGKKKEAPAEQVAEASLAADIQRDVDARNKRLADAAAKAKKKEAAAAKAAAPKPEKKPKIDDDAVWQHVQSKFSHHPDKDPVDSLRPVMQKHGIEDFNYFNKLARKHGHDNIYDAHHEIAGSEAELQEANFKYDVDHMPGQTVRGTLPKSCPTCYGRKSMYVTPQGKMYADKKTEDSKKVACPDCQGKGYVAEEAEQLNELDPHTLTAAAGIAAGYLGQEIVGDRVKKAIGKVASKIRDKLYTRKRNKDIQKSKSQNKGHNLLKRPENREKSYLVKTNDPSKLPAGAKEAPGIFGESNQDSNYLNNKKNQIRESILGKLAAKTGKK